jgi:hypothetical protein
VAAYNYVEPSVTEEDILISIDPSQQRPSSGLVTLAPILSYLKDKGYSDFRKEGILIEGWAVQFIPVANSLDAEALANAAEVDLEVNPREGSVSTRVLLPEHIVAIALRVGRARDRSRIIHILALHDYYSSSAKPRDAAISRAARSARRSPQWKRCASGSPRSSACAKRGARRKRRPSRNRSP